MPPTPSRQVGRYVRWLVHEAGWWGSVACGSPGLKEPHEGGVEGQGVVTLAPPTTLSTSPSTAEVKVLTTETGTGSCVTMGTYVTTPDMMIQEMRPKRDNMQTVGEKLHEASLVV